MLFRVSYPALRTGLVCGAPLALSNTEGLLGVGFFVVAEQGDDAGCGDHCEEYGGDHEVMHGIAPDVVGPTAIPTNPESQSCMNL